MNDLSKTYLDLVKEQTLQESSSFDVKHFPQTELLMKSLNEIFPEQAHESKTVQKAKEILGPDYSTEDVKATLASFEYLITNWLAEYEKKVFNGKTMKELLQSF